MSSTLFHVDSERGFRGGERQLLYLAAHLRACGRENRVVCRAGSALDREAARLGLRRLHLPFLGEWDPLSAWRLARAARAAGPGALVHAHSAHAAAVAALAERLGGPRWIAHRRVDFPLRGTLSRRLKYEAAAKVIAVSESIRRVLVDGGLDAERVAVVPDCLPLDAAEARAAGLTDGPLRPPTEAEARAARRELAERLGVPPSGPWLGNLAALVPHKDHANLLRAAPVVLRAEPRARFVLVGSGPLERGLRDLARALGVADSVSFAGQQPDPRPWLRAFDLYVQPSWGEGMGSVLLEAIACRVPIVATTAGGIPEVVSDGREALLVPPREPELLARALLAALADPAAARARAEAAAARLPAFGLTALGRRVEAIYDETLREARCPA